MHPQEKVKDKVKMHREMVKSLEDFFDCTVVFKDHGKAESLTFTKRNGDVMEIDAQSTAIDGAWIIAKRIINGGE